MDINDKIVQAIEGLRPIAFEKVRSSVYRSVLESSATEVMTFTLGNSERTYAPEVDIEYFKALYAFMLGREVDGNQVDSLITPKIVGVTEKAITEVLAQENFIHDVLEQIRLEAGASYGIHEPVGDGASLLLRTMTEAIGDHAMAELVSSLKGATGDEAVVALKSEAGQAAVQAFLKSAVSSVGLTAVGKVLASSIARAVAAGQFKTLSLAFLKKIALKIAIKTALVKVLAVLAPAIIGVKIPVFWVVMPLIAGFIYYEMKNIPKKLAEALPRKVAEEVDGAWSEIAKKASEQILANALQAVVSK
jgi:hypothetical protein